MEAIRNLAIILLLLRRLSNPCRERSLKELQVSIISMRKTAIFTNVRQKGIFRKDNFKPLVGDNVEITVLNEEEKEGSVTSILPRRNSLIRPAVANVDQAFLIFAMENPKPNFLLLDRFLIMMEQQKIPVVICFNKKDVGEKKEMEKLYEIYTGCGYCVVLSSTYEGRGNGRDPRDTEGKNNSSCRTFRWGNLPLPTVCRVKCRWRLARSAKTEARQAYHQTFPGNPGGEEYFPGGYSGIFFFVSYRYEGRGASGLLPGICNV